MKKATLPQACAILKLANELDVSCEQLQSVLMSGILADALTANMDVVNRDDVRRACGHLPLRSATVAPPRVQLVQTVAQTLQGIRESEGPDEAIRQAATRFGYTDEQALEALGRHVTLQEMMYDAARFGRSEGLYEYVYEDERRIPPGWDRKVIVFPETEALDGGYRYVRHVGVGSSRRFWHRSRVTRWANSSDFVAVPASIPCL